MTKYILTLKTQDGLQYHQQFEIDKRRKTDLINVDFSVYLFNQKAQIEQAYVMEFNNPYSKQEISLKYFAFYWLFHDSVKKMTKSMLLPTLIQKIVAKKDYDYCKN